MLTKIEEAIAERLESQITEPKHIDIDEAHSALGMPSIDILIGGGKFTKANMAGYKLRPNVFVVVTFQHLRSVADRRKGVYPILEAIVTKLVSQSLELKIDPLVPLRLDNITTEKEAKDGKIVFQIEFETGFVINKLSDAEINDLITIGLSYYLNSATTATADDEVTTIVAET